MKNYRLNIYLTDWRALCSGLNRAYVNSIWFEKVNVRIDKVGDDNPFEVIKFLRNGRVVAKFFPSDIMTYEVEEVD